MLEKVDLTKKMSKEEYKAKMPALESELGALQRECKRLGIPVMIVFEGYGASGKGGRIGRLIQSMDPRGFQVYPIKNETEEERMHPFLWRFWTKTPEKGKIAIFDGSWYRRVLIDRFEKRTKEKEIPAAFRSINAFEEQLTEDGTVMIKLFLDINQKEQKKRFDSLASKKETAWRVSQGDRERNIKFAEYTAMMEEMLFQTDTEYAPWKIVEAMDRRFATVKIYTIVVCALEEAVKKEEKRRELAKEQRLREKVFRESRKEAEAIEKSFVAGESKVENSLEIEVEKKDGVKNEVVNKNEELDENKAKSENEKATVTKTAQETMKELQVSTLSKVDLSLKYDKPEYEKKLKKLQKRIDELHGEIYRKRIPVVLAFEGWDAGGKGGAIKRLTAKMDPRGFVVNPTASPNDIEKAHHYLWRFWKNMPKDGHIAIFDRTWYGRVMVERIEGFCTEEEWKRAYKEINQMERDLYDAGTVILKFWMQIDKDEQERRFKERQQNPEKQWKITDEDWRNREKWDQYEEAVNEMLIRTSTEYAPWIIVEGNNKYYARIKVLETVVKALERALKKD